MAALMAALSDILSVPPFAIPISIGFFSSRIHFAQLAIFLSGLLGRSWAGLLTGAVGGLYVGVTTIPFIIGGLALLGFSVGFLAKRFKLRPFFSCVLAWCIQAPYVLATDYLWFVSFRLLPVSAALATIATILVKLTVEVVVAATLAEILIISLGVQV